MFYLQRGIFREGDRGICREDVIRSSFNLEIAFPFRREASSVNEDFVLQEGDQDRGEVRPSSLWEESRMICGKQDG